MSIDVETLVLDSFVPAIDRTPLDLNELGIEVDVEGADWGESQVNVQMQRRDEGSAPTDRHRPEVEMVIPLHLKEEGAVDFATAAIKLQQKVGLLQDEGGWVERRWPVGDPGNFAGAVSYQVFGASLEGIEGWLMAHKQFAREVVLKLIRHPIAYATAPTVMDGGSETTERELIFTEDDMLGSAKGLIALTVDNDSSDDWRGLIYAAESRDYPDNPATSNDLAYEAEDLTPLGDAAIATRTGGSGGGSNNVVRHSGLTYGWLAILSSTISPSTEMDHKGPRNVRMRVYDPGSTAEDVQLRLEWRALGSVRWTQNQIVASVPLVDDFAVVDLGVAFPQEPVTGDTRWEWRLTARALSGAGAIDIDKVYVLPTEQLCVLRESGDDPTPDENEEQFPGTLANDAAVGDVAWSDPGNAAASDGSSATAVLSAGEKSNYLKATNFGFSLPSDARVQLILVEVEKGGDLVTVDNDVRLIKGGSIVGSNLSHSGVLWSAALDPPYGDLEQSWEYSDINDSGFGFAISAASQYGSTASVDYIKITVYYTRLEDEARVCFAGRSIQLRNDGIARLDPTSDVWGKVVPEGFNPYAPPAFLEGRTMRGILIPSAGDLDMLPDDASPSDLTVSGTYHPGYHFARESSAS